MYYIINFVTMSICSKQFKTLPEAEMYWDTIREDYRSEWTIVKAVQN